MAQTVLIVDDEPQVLMLVARHLARLLPTYQLVTVATGAQALERCCDPSLALLITDLRLQDMTGVEIIASVHSRVPKLPVLLISGCETTAVAQFALDAGATAFLGKPFTVAELDEAVRALMPAAS